MPGDALKITEKVFVSFLSDYISNHQQIGLTHPKIFNFLTEIYIETFKSFDWFLITPYNSTISKAEDTNPVVFVTRSPLNTDCHKHSINPKIEKNMTTCRVWKQKICGWNLCFPCLKLLWKPSLDHQMTSLSVKITKKTEVLFWKTMKNQWFVTKCFHP